MKGKRSLMFGEKEEKGSYRTREAKTTDDGRGMLRASVTLVTRNFYIL